jgi:hypothetical protein
MESILNLEPHFIKDYWNKLDPKFCQLLEETSKLETWSLTNDSLFQSKLIQLTEIAKDWTTLHWSRDSKKITELMGHMTISQFAFLFHYLDQKFSGLSFHYVMEARSSENWAAGELLLERMKLIKGWNSLGRIFSPLRTRLISGLLDPRDE